jgi:predicted nucleotidyltransferase component of viral defense system
VKTSTQVKALIRNLSKKSNVETEVLLRNFMMERFLERISVSDYRHNFILKGGMLIAAMVGIDTRTTMDMDATIKGQTLTEPELTAIVEGILRTPVDDGMKFTLCSIGEIREGADYPGYRVSIAAVLDKTRQTLKIDITTGDFITPREIEYRFKLMLEDRTISIMAYNLETVLAEKFEAVVTRGTTSTRMRDYYDIYILTTTQPFDADTFRVALQKTVEKRGVVDQMADRADVIQRVAESPIMLGLWQRYQKKYSYATKVTWEMAIGAVKALAEKSSQVVGVND